MGVLRPCNRRTSRKMTSPGESSATTLPSPSPAAGRKKEATTMTLARSCALILISLTTSASVAAGSEMPLVDPLYHFNPCSFNPQCLCSTGAAEYGSVICDGVEMADIPSELQEARVFKLHLRNNGLHRFPDAKLQGTGMWKLEVSHNPVSTIPSMAFYGLERALWEVHLPHNKLTRIPSDSLTLLKKLSVLNLADNRISDLQRDELQSLTGSLKSLDLSGNSLTSVPEGIFWNLQRLETLSLARNNIIQIHSMAFQNGVNALAHLDLRDNLMGKIPFGPISHVKTLKTLDLSQNRIEKVHDPFFTLETLRLDQLYLQENHIEVLTANSFANFEFINFTSLSGNPLRIIEKNAFKEAQMKRLDISNCLLHNVSEKAFKGLERNLEMLDLSANRLKDLPDNLLEDFDMMKDLRLSDNMLRMSPNASFLGFRYSLKDLSLLGEDMGFVPLREIGLMRNLRTVGLAGVRYRGEVTEKQFRPFAPGLEELNLVSANLNQIGRNAFAHVPSISKMDLSNNRITRIANSAFNEVGNALGYLKMSNALYFTSLPNIAFHALSAMEVLDLSDNHIRDIPLDTFHKMSRLRFLYLQNNEVSQLKRGIFHSQANPELNVLDLSFNQIISIPYDTFRFPKLERLILDDNRIQTIETKAIVEMTGLRYLSLEGNELKSLPGEAFQNLHYLSTLNLAYNKINMLDFAAFDSVGTLSHLVIDLSHNDLNILANNRTTSYPTSSNIMTLDLSSNNISFIEVAFFHPVQNVLKILNMSHNALTEINPESLGHIRKLYSIDLSHNLLVDIKQGTFFASKKLQMVYLNNNALSELNPGLFGNHRYLKVVDLSWNRLNTLPEQLFQRTSLEIFRAAHNSLHEIPIKSLNPVQSTLKHLDLTGNRITTISDSQLNQIQSLVELNLAQNHITIIDNQAFCCLPSLSSLDLSFNPLKRINAATFTGVRTHLQILKIANTSLTLLPSFQLPQLKTLNVSSNHLTFVAPETMANLSNVRDLDLSRNELATPPSSAWHSMHHLRTLNLAGNPISQYMNDSFLGLDKLEFLDVSDIPVVRYQSGALGTMPNLRSLKLNIDGKVSDFNLATLLGGNHALETLYIHLIGEALRGGGHSGKQLQGSGTALRHELQDTLPTRLKNIIIQGPKIENIHPAAFKYLRSRRLSLKIMASEEAILDRDLFLNLGQVQNLSLDLSEHLAIPEPPVVVLNDDGDADQEIIGGGSGAQEPPKQVVRPTMKSVTEESPHELGNPVTSYSPNHPRAVFLHDLKIGHAAWHCTCDGIGWAEKWLRRWRGVFCGHETQIQPLALSVLTGRCLETVRDLRSAKCVNSEDRSVLTSLQYDLECDAFNSSVPIKATTVKLWWLLLISTTTIWRKILF